MEASKLDHDDNKEDKEEEIEENQNDDKKDPEESSSLISPKNTIYLFDSTLVSHFSSVILFCDLVNNPTFRFHLSKLKS